VGCDLGRSVRAAGSVRMMPSKGRTVSAVKGWVNHLQGFVQLGLGRVVAGLLEGLLIGPKDISVRKRVRAVLKSLNGSKGFWFAPFLPTDTGRVYGLRKVKSGLKGVGLGCSFKSKRAMRLKPSHRVRPLAMENSSLAVGLVSSSQLASEVRLGASVVEPTVPERWFRTSLLHTLGSRRFLRCRHLRVAWVCRTLGVRQVMDLFWGLC
jgi:hypothetical protein